MSNVVTKANLIATVAEKSSLSKAKTELAINTMIQSIKDALASGQDVSMVGFGTFTVSKRAARKGRNPKTGESIDIPEKTVPKFRPGKDLREAVDTK